MSSFADRAAADDLAIAAVLKDETSLAGVHDIEVQDGLAYLAGKGGSLAIVDVHQPASPRLVWTVREPMAYEDAETVLPLNDRRLLVGTRDLLLFDIQQPANPRLLTRLEDRARIDRINGFARRGDIVFAACKSGFVIAVDVSDPGSLRLLGSRNARELDGLASPHDVALLGDLLLVVSPEGFGRTRLPGKLSVYRVMDPKTARILPVDQWQVIGHMEHNRLAGANRVKSRAQFAFVCGSLAQNMGRDDDLKSSVSVVDLSDPTMPKLAASVDFPDPRGPNGLEISGAALFAAGGQTVLALDVSNPGSPQQLGRLTGPAAFPGAADDAHDLIYHSGYLLVTAQTSNALVILRPQENDSGLKRTVDRGTNVP